MRKYERVRQREREIRRKGETGKERIKEEEWRNGEMRRERKRDVVKEIKRGKKVRGRKIILKCYFLKTIFKNFLKQVFSIVFFSIIIENI